MIITSSTETRPENRTIGWRNQQNVLQRIAVFIAVVLKPFPTQVTPSAVIWFICAKRLFSWLSSTSADDIRLDPISTSDLSISISWPHWRNSRRRSRAYKSRHFKYIHWITSICDFLSIITNWKHKTSFTTTHDATPIGIMNYLNFILHCRRNTNCCWHDGTSFCDDLELKMAFCGEVNLKASWQFMISAIQGVLQTLQQRVVEFMWIEFRKLFFDCQLTQMRPLR